MKSAVFKITFSVFLLSYSLLAKAQQPDSLDIKIGQMILVGLSQANVDQKVLESVRNGKVGSIILFEKNIPIKNSYIGLKKITWTYQQASTIPLFIAIDQEGGRVNRLKEKYGFPRSVSAAKLGKYPLDSVRFYSETTAATLAGLGFNVNFAPVVDLASNPNNPIIAKVERAFSERPDSVTLFAHEFIKQHRKLGVVTVLKHFPGHGSSKEDTHLGLADVTNTWNADELSPYRTLINQGGADAIMTAHIVNKKLDESGLPGTLSKKITSDLLRTTLGYQGVIFSDDLQMHAITKYYGLESAITLAIGAGVDILIFSNNIQGTQERTVDKVHQIIRKLVENGSISETRISQSFNRIMKLKERLGITQAEYYRSELLEAKNEIDKQTQIAEKNVRLAEGQQEKLRKAEDELKEQQQGKTKKPKKKRDN